MAAAGATGTAFQPDPVPFRPTETRRIQVCIQVMIVVQVFTGVFTCRPCSIVCLVRSIQRIRLQFVGPFIEIF